MAAGRRIRWLARQVKRLRDAVRTYNRTVNRLRNSGLYDYVPLNTSFAEEKRRLDEYGGGSRALNQRIGQLRRIQKGVRSDAWDVVTMPDGKTPGIKVQVVSV